jgi:invasion protein IalB
MRLTLTGLPAIAIVLSLFNMPGHPKAAPANLWQKVCTKRPLMPSSLDAEAGDVCQTVAHVLDSKTGALVSQLAVRRLPGQAGYQIDALMPLNSGLLAGVLIKIDERQPIKLEYKRCDAAGCVARVTIGDDILAQMRSGTQIAYAGIDVTGKRAVFRLSLAGFGETFDGQPLTLDKYRSNLREIRQKISGKLAEANKPGGNPLAATTQKFANAGNPVVNSGWFKLCQDVKQQAKVLNVCLTQVDVRDEKTLIMVGKIGVRKIQDQEGNQIIVLLPINISLPEGATVTIDKKEQIKLVFWNCDVTACYAQGKISDATLAQLKASQEIAYSGTDEKGDTLVVPVSLSGFASVYEGAPMSRQAYDDELRRVSEQIIIRASRARKQRQTP